MEIFISVMAVLMIILLGGYPLFSDLKKDGEINWPRFLTVIGIILATIAFNVIDQLEKGTSVTKDKTEAKDSLNSKAYQITTKLDTLATSLSDTTKASERRIIDSSKVVADQSEKRYEKYRDSINNDEKPLIDIYPKDGHPNPVLISTEKKDSFNFVSYIINDGAIARDFNETVTFLAHKYGRFSSTIVKKNAQTNEGRVLSKAISKVTASLAILTTELDPQDTIFICISVGYSDAKRQRCLPIYRIFRYTYKQWNITLPDATKDEYLTVKKYMIENKLWDFRL